MLATPFFAAVFALFYVFLSFGVIRLRLGEKVSLGDGDNRDLKVAIRVHSNFIEYVPLSLLLMWFIETALFDSNFALILGVMLLLGRVLHVFGMNNPSKYMLLRQVGMLATLSVLIIGAVRILWHYVPSF